MELYHVVYMLIAFLIGRFWWLTTKARERAEKIAQKLCAQENMQLLDGTVALNKLEIKRTSGLNFRLIRLFRFEFSAFGSERRTGVIALHNLRQEYTYMDLPEKPVIEVQSDEIQ